ncbi:MAG: hypothetical protein KGY69_01780 [Bacteroidales bacterium]|nr:hypothetical protein [Bacteroidales bacterium]
MKTSCNVFLFWLISLVLIVFILSGCMEDKFDLEKLSDEMELSPKFSAPLARGSITLEDMVDDDGENIVLDSSGTHPYIKMVYREDSIFSFDGNDLFEVNESGEESYTLGNIELGEFGPVSQAITLGQIVDNAVTHQVEAEMIKDADGESIEFPAIDESDPMEIGGDYEVDEIDNFRYAEFDSGEIEITITNNMPVEVTAEFTLRTKILESDGSLDEDNELKHFEFPDISVGDSLTETFDLSGETLGSVLYATDVALSTPGTDFPVLIDLDNQNITIDAHSRDLVISGGEVSISEQILQNQETTVSVGYSGERRLDTIRLAGGGLDLTIDNNTNIPAYLKLSLPNSKYPNGDTVAYEHSISAQSTTSGELDLTDSETIITSMDSLPVEYTLRLESTQDFVEFHASDRVDFSYNLAFDSDHIEYVSGYFGNDTLDFDGDVFDTGIQLFDNLSGDFLLTDPKLKLFYSNTIGIPFTVDLDLVAESKENQQNLNEGDADGLLNFASPTLPFTTVSDTIVINNNTSDIDKFISLPPRQIRFSGTGYTNFGNDPSAYNFITSENLVNVGMEMDLPLELETSGLTYRDTVGFDMDVDFDEAVNLYGIFKNQFPFSIDIQVVCRDSVTNRDLLTLEPLDADGQNASILDAPEVDENGRVKSPKENRIYFKVTGDEIDLLNEANQLALEATVKTSKTSEGNYTGVKFYTDYTLDFRMGIDETGTKLDF